MTTLASKRLTIWRAVLLAVAVSLLVSLVSPTASQAAAPDAPAGTDSVLVVAPHPGDATIMAAGITYSLPSYAAGAGVTIAYMSNNDFGIPGGDASGALQLEAVTAQVSNLNRAEPDLIFLGYPDGHLLDVWGTADPAVYTPVGTGLSATYASRGLGLTDWYDYRTGSLDMHADYNREAMVADMEALIDQRRPSHIFTGGPENFNKDYQATYNVVSTALDNVIAANPGYGAVLHTTVVWHPDDGLHSTWPQDRDPTAAILLDTVVDPTASPTLADEGLVWADREEFIVPAALQDPSDVTNPKSLAITAIASQGGLGGFIGRFVHLDEIFWAEYVNFPALSINDVTVTEGSPAVFTISRTGALNVPVSVTATTSDGTAIAGVDYTATTETVDLAAGEASATFTVPTLDDALVEADKTFTVTLSAPSMGATLADATGIGTITSEDVPPTVVVAVDGLSAGSTGVAAEFTASVVSGGTGTVTYAWTATRGATTVGTGTGATFSFTPTAGGLHTVTVVPSDDVGPGAPVAVSLNVLTDIEDSTFVNDIIWLADAGITAGCNPPVNDRFCPDNNVTRGQMAAFLVRFLGLTDDGGGNKFVDAEGSVFEDDIAKLAAAGITAGCNPPVNDRYCPNDRVTRGQMAAFLVRALGLTDDGGGNKFVDAVGSVFEDDIAKLAAAGITAGCNPPTNDRYCPDSNVTRGQMAAFIRRADALP